MSTCKTCKHWNRKKPSDRNSHEQHPCWHPYLDAHIEGRNTARPHVVCDGKVSVLEIFTSGDFGCIHHEGNPPLDTPPVPQ